MTIFNAKRINDLADGKLALARKRLAGLPVCCGHAPNIAGLHGWVFEQTIQHCLRKELEAKGHSPTFREQVRMEGRAKADFAVGHVMVEVKAAGLFGGGDVERYKRYCRAAEKKGFRYLFLTAHENSVPYRRGIIEALDKENVFLLNEAGDWQRFVTTVAKELQKGDAVEEA
jgi:hypothetical protein